MKIKLGILFGGSSIEREVSICSANEVLNNIDKDKYDIFIYDIPKDKTDKEWIKKLIDNPPDIVLSTLHGGSGENGNIQGLLNCLCIPYVGSGVLSSALGMNKHISKMIMKANYIPVIDDIFIKKNENIVEYEEKIKQLGFPVIIKPNNGGSSLGISVANNYDEVIKAVNEVINYNDDILIEKFISGKEVTCCVINTENKLDLIYVLDINTLNQFYDYKAKYIDNMTKINISSLPEFLKIMIQEVAKKVFNVLECKGYACIDMIVHEEQIYVIEINTLPGLTKNSLITKASEYSSNGFSKFIDNLIKYELNNNLKKN